MVAVDTQEVSPPSLEIFRIAALRPVDRLLGAELGGSTTSLNGSTRADPAEVA